MTDSFGRVVAWCGCSHKDYYVIIAWGIYFWHVFLYRAPGQLFGFGLKPDHQLNQCQQPKNNVLHERWLKNHDKNKCRRVGVGNRQN